MSRSLAALGIFVALLAFGACSKQEAPGTPTPAVEQPPVTTLTNEAVPAPPAESSLALKRGILTLAAQQATFQPCGESALLWVIDQTDGVLRQTFAGDASPAPLYIEAHGERTPTPAEIAAAKGHPAAFIVEEVLYAAPAGEGQGCAQGAPSYIVRAQGNEPFWSVEVMTDQMIWRQPDEPKELTIDSPQSQDSEGTVGYSGSAGGHSVELFIDAQSCRDSMSGAYFAYAARADFDGKELKGCARIGE